MAKSKYYIIVDEARRPMAWAGNQLCYCNDETWQDKPHVLVPYTEGRARNFISKSTEYERANKANTIKYFLMPINLPNKFKPYNK